jgi:hypothetical protein
MAASEIAGGILLRSINKAGRVWGGGFSPKVIWGVVKEKEKICEIHSVLLTLLDIFNSQRRQFRAPQAAGRSPGEWRVWYGVTTVLLKASLGSKQYHSMNSLIA